MFFFVTFGSHRKWHRDPCAVSKGPAVYTPLQIIDMTYGIEEKKRQSFRVHVRENFRIF
jgi:hypothetical protein